MGNGFSTTPVSRITLFCRDLDQSLELYRDILGFKEIENKTIQSKEFNQLMNIEDENCFVRISYLQSEESEHGLIALFEINSNNLDKNESFEKPAIQYGQSVIVLNTKDHEKIYQVLRRIKSTKTEKEIAKRKIWRPSTYYSESS